MSDAESTPKPTNVHVVGLATSIEKFQPQQFKVDEKFKFCVVGLHSDITAVPDTQDTGAPTKKEIKLMEQTFMEYAKEKCSFEIWQPIDKLRFLVKDDEKSSEAMQKLENMKRRVLLRVFEGEGKPYEAPTSFDEAEREKWPSPYHKIYLPGDHKSKRRVRFSQVELWDDDANDSDSLELEYGNLQTRLVSERKADFRLYQAEVKTHVINVTLRGLVSHMLDSDNIVSSKQAEEIVNAFLSKELAGQGSNFARHGDKFYIQTDTLTTDSKGLKLVKGNARHLGFNDQGEMMMASRPVHNLFFPTDTVANFLNKQYAKKLERTSSNELSDLLRGKFVTKGKTGACPVAIIRTDLDDPVHFLQLGSTTAPQKATTTSCTFTSMQSCKAKSKQPTEEIASVRVALSADGSATIQQNVIFQKIEKPDEVSLQTQFERLFGGRDRKPVLLFVNVTITGATVKDGQDLAWIRLQDEVSDHHRISQTATERTTPLVLNFNPNGGNFITEWSTKLRRFVHSNRKADRKAFLVVAVPGGAYNRRIYDALKNICDTVVGIQSFFVSSGSLGSSGVSKKIAGNVVHRMRLRNPQMLSTASPGEAQDLAVAVHISRIPINTSTYNEVTGRKEQTLFLVNVVARNMGSAKDYYANVSLINIDDAKIKDPMAEVANLAENFGPPPVGKTHRITVFRSGFMSLAKSSISNDGSRQIDLIKKHINPANLKLEAQDAYGKSTEASKTEAAKTEFSLLSSHIGALSHLKDKFQLSYVLVGEDESFVNSKEQMEANAEAIKKAQESFAPSEKHVAAFSASQYSKHSADQNTFSALRHMSGNSKLVTLSLIGGSLASSEASSSATTKDFERLSKVFCDDHLGLYDTKFPIPTHLAHLAAERAMCHLRTDAADSSAPGTAPFFLPEVAAGVRDSLYYL